MTRMLAIVRSATDAAAAVAGGVDGIVVSSTTEDGAAAIRAAVQAKCPVALWMHATDAVGMAGDLSPHVTEIWEEPGISGQGGPRWTVVTPDRASSAAVAAARGGTGIVIVSGGTHRLLADLSIAEIEQRRREAMALGLRFGFAGTMEAPDVPRLLALRPEVMAFDDLLRDEQSAISAAKVRLVRDLVADWPMPDAGAELTTVPGVSDRIFVRDWIASLHVGAYDHENAPQRVRFNVEAEVVRSVGRASDMRHVVTYDLITDAIARATITHVALVETIAEDVAAMILDHPRVSGVDVSVEKLDLGPGALGCRILRRRAS